MAYARAKLAKLPKIPLVRLPTLPHIPDAIRDKNAPTAPETSNAPLSKIRNLDSVLADSQAMSELCYDNAEWNALRGLKARLRFRMFQRLKSPDFVRLTRLNQDQIAHALSESSYTSEARDLGLKYSGSELVRAMVAAELEHEMQQLIHMTISMPASTAWIRNYRWQHDLFSLRSALRARQTDGDAPISMLSPLGNLPHRVYDWLVKATELSVKDQEAEMLAASPFATVLLQTMRAAERPSEDELETLLIQAYYLHILQPAQFACQDSDSRAWILDQAHLINAMTGLSARLSNSSQELAAAMMLPFSYWHDENAINSLMTAPTYSDYVKLLRQFGGKSSFSHLKNEEINELNDPGSVERLLTTSIMRGAHRLLHAGKPATATIWAYLFLLEREARNLWLIISGCDGNIDPDIIKSLLVLA